MKRFALLIVLTIPAAFGQTAPNSITVTAYRSTTLQPDEVVFSVYINSSLDAILDDVLAALAGSGLSIANFQGVSTSQQWFDPNATPAAMLTWSFALPVPWSKMKDTITMLTALQKSVPEKNSALTLSFSVQGTQVSPQLQQMTACSASDLLADARAQAQKFASAANLVLGTVLGISGSTSSDGSTAVVQPYAYYSLVPPCTMTVKFAATR